jgi:hypothetical protein
VQWSTVVCLVLGAASAAAAQATCSVEQPIAASLGFSAFHCFGGSCEVALRDEVGPFHSFTVEPHVAGLDPRGVAAGILEEADVIVSIDGHPITSRAGGRLIASVIAGQAVTLRIRRGGRESLVRVTPKAGCHRPGIAVADSPEALGGAAAFVREASGRNDPVRNAKGTLTGGLRGALTGGRVDIRPTVDFGMTLTCGDCGWRQVGATTVFWTSDPPVVIGVIAGGPADRAGVGIGDTLVSLQGSAFVDGQSAGVWTALRPGLPIKLEVRRRTTRRLTIVPVPAAGRF